MIISSEAVGASAAASAPASPLRALRTLAGEATPVLLIGALPLLFFWRLLTPRLVDHAHVLWGDFAAQYYPLRLFVARELAQGRLPLWNPFVNGGQPALADSQSAVFYPPNMVLALLAPGGELSIESLEYYMVGHFVLAGIFTYLFGRYTFRAYGRPVARMAAAIVACAFTFGGYLTSFPVQQLSILEAAVWLPPFLLLLEIARHRRSLLAYGLAALPIAMSWTAGHAQTTMYIVYAALACQIGVLLLGRGRAALRHLAGTLLAVSAGTALAALQLLPTYEFLNLSTRVDLGYADTSFGLPLRELPGVVLPNVFGGPSLYIGVVGAVLALLAVFAEKRPPLVAVWAACGMGGLLVALGGNTILYSALYILAPGFSSVRDQERAIYIFSFFASALAGQGAAILLSKAEGVYEVLQGLRRLLLWSGLACLGFLVAESSFIAGNAGVANANRAGFLLLILLLVATLLHLLLRKAISGRWALGLCLALLLFDLFTVNWQRNVVAAKEAPFAANKLATTLTKEGTLAEGRRISSEGLLPGGGSAASVFELPDMVANTPFQLKRFAQIGSKVDELQRSRLFSVGYWITKRRLDDGRFHELATQGDVRLYELDRSVTVPRAYVVHEIKVLPEDEALSQLPAADIARVALLTKPDETVIVPNEPNSAMVPPAPSERSADEVRFMADAPQHQTVNVRLSTPGALVVAENYYPGWRAMVDGRETTIWRAQYGLRGVLLDAGQHRVEFIYEPQSLRTGTRYSLGAAALLVLAIAGAQIAGRLGRGAPKPSG